MALELQNGVLDQAPFWDDYNENDNYHKVLFRPSVAVQARELTQLQTILQNQIERFGENIYKTGTVIKGCTQSFDSNYQYAKILDNQVDGQPCNMSLYANTLVIGTANLRAYAVNTVTGLQTQDPDLNTLYLKYLNTGTGGEKTFTPGQTLTVYNRNRRVESVTVTLGGTLYSNTDTVVFTAAGTGGDGAVGTIVTYANGTIKDVILNEKGSGYIDPPTLSITTSTGSGGSLVASVEIAQLTIANSSFYTDPIGTGYAVNVSDGIIFQKGHFVRFDSNTAIVSKYSTAPNNAVVGFSTTESIANNTADVNLLDNSAGSLNYKAPGAYRLKLTPTLVVKTKEEAAANNAFFGIVEFQNGHKVRQSEETQFNVIGNQLAKRTFEESGNYVVRRFPITTEAISGNTTHINASVGAGIAYVEGFRVENLDNIRVPLRKATDTTVDYAQSVATNYGNYVLVNELAGSFGSATGASVSLRNTAGNNISTNYGGSPTSPGSQIGTAKIRAVEYENGNVGSADCTYRLYLFDIQMSSGRSFADVRAISSAGVACADPVLEYGNAVLQEVDYNSLIFSVGTRAVASLNNESFIYRSQVTRTGLFNTSGVATITLSGAEDFPYTPSSTLNNTQERDFIIIPTNSTYGSLNTGNVQTYGNSTVQANTGSTTAFLSEYNVGETIRIGSDQYEITQIISDSRLEVRGSPGAATGQAHRIAFPAYVPISTLRRTGASISIDSTGTQAEINLGSGVGTLNAAMDGIIHFNSKVVGANISGAAQTTKTITKNVYVKISNTAIAAAPNGPWCIGLPDVHKIAAVYRGTGSTYNESTDVTSGFTLDNGQNDNLYGLGYISKKAGTSITLGPNNNLLVKLEVYTRNSGYYLSAESYPVDDATVPLPGNKIRSQEIELYTSTSTGAVYDLRDCVDFRPAVSNTANVATTAAGATIDPSSTSSLPGGVKHFPAPNETFTVDITSYMGRIDRVTLDSTGQIRITEGTPSNFPTSPIEPQGSMTLGLISVPPFPTLPFAEARAAERPDLATQVSLVQQRRYTMKDIQDIEARISQLEYYSLLNSLEQNTKNLIIPSEANTAVDRFKNGFFVDPFDNYDIANVNDPEFRMFIDVYNSEARPTVLQYDVELEYTTALNDANTVLTGDTVTLAYSQTPLITQPHATKYRNCVENSYNYKGKIFSFPAYDNYYDTTTSPQTLDVNIAGALDPLIKATNDALTSMGGRITITNTSTNETFLSSTSTAAAGGRNVTNVFDQTITSTGYRTTPQLTANSTTTTQQVGNYVTNFALQPYIRSQAIKIAAVGLRPGAKHYVFFDKVNVTQYCQPATVSSTTTFSDDGFILKGTVADDIYATEQGVVTCVLYLPASTFFCGEREIVVLDVNDFDSQTSAASRATGTFNAYNFTVDKQALSLNTKTINTVKMTETVTDYVSTTRGNVNRTTFVATPPSDPIAQSFRVPSPEAGVDGAVVTSLDLYFQRKDTVQGVVVEIREMLLGTPTSNILPNAVARLPANLVNTSPDASTPTTFTFASPVYLRTDTEYAFVVYPEGGSPEYLIWTGESGGNDVTDPELVKKSDWGSGAMFLSTNGTTWNSYQFEDVKFTLKRAVFTESDGLATLSPKGYEFLTIESQGGSFEPGEYVAQKGSGYGPGLVYANTSSQVLDGSGTSFSSNLTVGDRIMITYGTDKTSQRTGTVSGNTTSSEIVGSSTQFLNDYAVNDYIQLGDYVRQVQSVANNTSMTVDAALRSAVSGASHYGVTPVHAIAKVLGITSSTQITLDTVLPIDSTSGSSIVANYQKVVSGIVAASTSVSNRLVVKQSTAANSTFKMIAGRTIVGSKSQASATIVSVDDIGASYIEPHVQTFVPPATTTTFTTSITRAANSQIVTQSGEHGISNWVPFPAVVKSRSNEISGASYVDSFTYQQQLSSVTGVLSPLLDTNPGSILFIENVVDNYVPVLQTANTFSNTLLQTDTTNLAVGMCVQGLGISDDTVITSINGANVEISIAASLSIDANLFRFTSNDHKPYGISKNRYISKRLALADGLDAEDLKLFITAYRPVGAEIEVYAKILNGADGDSFNNKDWSKLVQSTNSDQRSDSLNPTDYREFQYTFDTTPPGIAITGTGRTDVSSNTANVEISGFGTEFDSELVVGDFIKLSRTSDQTLFDIRRVATIADFNTLTVDTAPTFTADGITIEKILEPNVAFKNALNDGIVRYYNDAGAYFDTYKYMAVKIVLRSTSGSIVPTVQDIRAIAVSI